MQNSYHKLNIKEYITNHYAWTIILLLMPFILWGIILILPTFDDWTSLIAPSNDPLFTKERFLFYGYHWRPFDSIFGWIVGRNPKILFPTLNHICVFTGHLGCTFLIYKLTVLFKFNPLASNISILFFFFTPAMLATVLAVDGLNQTYANFWGLLAAIIYIKLRGKTKYLIYFLLISISALCKENGLMWAIIIPLMYYGFDYISFKQLSNDILIGLCIIILYAAAILLLPKNIEIHPEYIPTCSKIINSILKYILSSWFAVDFVYLFFKPDRNIPVAAITFLLSLPLIYYIFRPSNIKKKVCICLLICQIIAVSPHLATVYSMMHTYAGLSFTALLIGYTINTAAKKRNIKIAFILFMIVAFFVDIHLWHTSYESGLIGKKMAKEAILKTGKPVDRVHLIIIEEDFQKVSSFRVIPSDAFGWGIAAKYENNYIWPKTIKDTTIERSSNALNKAHTFAKDALKSNQFDCIWIVNHDSIYVISQ